MDPYDTQAVRAVWERVRLSHEQLLASMIAREQQDRDFYRRIARQAGPMGKRLLSIATEEEKHLQQLRELYNSLYGALPSTEPPMQVRYRNLRQALEAQREKELADAQSYSKAANHYTAYAELFLALSNEEKSHGAILSDLLDGRKSMGQRNNFPHNRQRR